MLGKSCFLSIILLYIKIIVLANKKQKNVVIYIFLSYKMNLLCTIINYKK